MHEQAIDETSTDEVIEAGYSAAAADRARRTVESWEQFCRGQPRRDHRPPDPLRPATAGQRLTFREVKELSQAIAPPAAPVDAREALAGLRAARPLEGARRRRARAHRPRLARPRRPPPGGRARAVPRPRPRALPRLAPPAGERRPRVHHRAARLARTHPRPRRRGARDHDRRLRLHAVRRGGRARQGGAGVRRRARRRCSTRSTRCWRRERAAAGWANTDARRRSRDCGSRTRLSTKRRSRIEAVGHTSATERAAGSTISTTCRRWTSIRDDVRTRPGRVRRRSRLAKAATLGACGRSGAGLDGVGNQKALASRPTRAGVSTRVPLAGFMRLAAISTRSSSDVDRKHDQQHLRSGGSRQIAIPLPPLNEQRRIVAAIEEHLSRLDAADASLAAAAATARRACCRERSTRRLGSCERTHRSSCPIWRRSPTAGSYGIRRRRSRRCGVAHASRWRMPASADRRSTEHRAALRRSARGRCGGHARRRRPLLDRAIVRRVVGRPARVPASSSVRAASIHDACDDRSRSRSRRSCWTRSRRHGATRRRISRDWQSASRNRTLTATIRAVRIPLPPLDEQRRIVARVEEQLSAIDALRAAIERAQRRSASLRRAVLERAFRGELVPQDPSDEPASVLLERIRAERTAAASSKRSRSSRSRA